MYVLGVDAGLGCPFSATRADLDALCILMDYQSFHLGDSAAVNTEIFRVIFEVRMARSLQTSLAYFIGSA